MIVRLTNAILRHARLAVWLGMILGLAAGILSLTRGRSYTSSASFLVQSTSRMPGNVPGIAAQLGLSLPASDPGQSPAFYLEIMRSREVLDALVDTSFTFKDAKGVTVTAKLADVFRVSEAPVALRRVLTRQALNNVLKSGSSLKSGLVTFSMAAPSADLAAQMSRMLLAQLERFNQQRRQSTAVAERQFTEGRLAEALADLRKAESEVQEFLRANRGGTDSPELRFRKDRIEREMELKRSIHTTLAQSFEQARIEQVRNTPQITVVEKPEVPARGDPRQTIGKTLTMGVFGFVLGLLIGLGREKMQQASAESPAEAAEARRRLRSIVRDVFRFRSSPPRGNA
jgi:uncharacterized protein involved in exopolysaccharide biosynthesis